MAGTLYIVATPIGNLDDMPPRVAATFGNRAAAVMQFSEHYQRFAVSLYRPS